jgi:xanthine dehydrogenase YagR molybdenum-binding subunit
MTTTQTAPPAPDTWGPGDGPDPLIDRHGLIGAPISRLDGPLKVKGAAQFAAEFVIPGMVYAALVYSTIPKGRLATLDVRAAENAPGVVLVMTYRNAPRMAPGPVFLTAEKAAAGDDLPIMQDEQIYWNGQPIAVVLAETQEQADHAKSFVRATYAAVPAITSFSEAKTHACQATFAGNDLAAAHGDAEAALAAAPFKVDNTYHTPFQNHNAMELHAATLVWQGNELTIHDCTQGVAHEAWSLAQIFGINEEQIHISAPFVGGGFGGKSLWQHQILGAAAAKLSGRAVRVVLSREGVYRVVGGRAMTEQRVAIGAQADGRFDALIQIGTTAKTPHNAMPEPFILPAMCLYSSKNVTLDVQAADMDMLGNTFMRAPGEAVGSFALESAIDELAARMELDPIELRIRNEPENDPTMGTPFSSRHLVEAYRAGAERFGWSERNARPGTRREGEWLIGLGCATATYPYHRMAGGAVRMTLNKAGHATVAVAAHDMGMGTATVQTQVIAERLGLPFENVTFLYGDTSLPGLVLAGGSQQTASIGAATIAAQRALVAELLTLVRDDSPLAGLRPDEVESAEGGVLRTRHQTERRESYASILAHAQHEEVTVEATAPPPDETQRWSMHSYGALFCEVRVNAVTGETRVSRFLGSYDCGRILNAKTGASQLRGGIIMGLGLALMEETLLGERNARVVNPSLAEYHVPVHMDVPEIDIIWTDIPDPHAPMGAHGVGEIGITGVGAAVANAVYNATGTRVRDLPITLDKLLPDL